MFGTQVSKCLEYVLIDDRSAARATRRMRELHMGLASDHIPIGTEINLNDQDWNIAERMRRGQPKQIRWTLKLENTNEWEASIQQWCDKWNSMMDTADATELLQRLQHLGGGRRRMTPRMARLKLEDDLKRKITRVDISESYRDKLRQQLSDERGRIAKQKELNHYREVLQNL